MPDKNIHELIGELLSTGVSDATAIQFGVDNGSSASLRFKLSEVSKYVNSANLTIPSATLRKVNGTITQYFPTAATAVANGQAFTSAIAAAGNGDIIELNASKRYEPTTGGGFSLSGLTDVAIRNGLFCRNGGTGVYTNMLELDTCRNITLDNITFDGEAGISAPTAPTPVHIVSNGNNAGAYTNMVTLIASHGTIIRGCTFRDHAGTVDFTGDSLPFYTEAMGVDIGSTCTSTVITGSTFSRVGYAGIATEGKGTQIADCVFDDVQWHGVVVRRGSATISDNAFQRLAATTIGYQGGIDINPAAQVESCVIENNTFDFQYDYLANTLGMYLIKGSDTDLLVIRGNKIKHGNNGSATTTARDSIRIEGDAVKTLVVEDNWCSGCLGHTLGGGASRYVATAIVRKNHFNQTAENRFGCVIDAGDLTFEANNVKYARVGLTHITTPLTKSLTCRDNLWQSLDTENAYAIPSSTIANITDRVIYDRSNRLKNGSNAAETYDGQTVSFINRKSETATGRLTLSTGVAAPEKKNFDPTLPANFDHGTQTALTNPIKDLERRTNVPHVMIDDNIQLTKGNFQKRTLTTNSTLAISASPAAADEGTFFRVLIINPAQAYTLSIPSTWNPLNAYVQPAAVSFSIGFELIDDGTGTILPRFAGVI